MNRIAISKRTAHRGEKKGCKLKKNNFLIQGLSFFFCRDLRGVLLLCLTCLWLAVYLSSVMYNMLQRECSLFYYLKEGFYTLGLNRYLILGRKASWNSKNWHAVAAWIWFCYFYNRSALSLTFADSNRKGNNRNMLGLFWSICCLCFKKVHLPQYKLALVLRHT